MSFENIDLMMQHAVEGGIFPGGALVFSKSGKVLFNRVYGHANIFTGQPVTHHTFFDLASLTKPLATSLALMALVQEGKLELEQTLGSIIKQFNINSKSSIQLRHLLCHNSGLPAYQPYFSEINNLPFCQRKDVLRRFLVEEKIVSSIGKKTIYSDIGFMILEWVIETITGASLDYYLYQAVYHPMRIRNLFFINLENTLPDLNFAATELCPWRRYLLQGIVHDENAYVMGGVSGHAGLFGTAYAVHQLLSNLMQAYTFDDKQYLFKKQILHLFFNRQIDSNMALGFDKPSEIGSSCGDLFFKNMTIGHLGFTGTSFWMDLFQSIIIVLLTNRIHPSRNNERIKLFRPILHNAVMNKIISSYGT